MAQRESRVKGEHPTRKQIAKAVNEEWAKRRSPNYNTGLFAPDVDGTAAVEEKERKDIMEKEKLDAAPLDAVNSNSVTEPPAVDTVTDSNSDIDADTDSVNNSKAVDTSTIDSVNVSDIDSVDAAPIGVQAVPADNETLTIVPTTQVQRIHIDDIHPNDRAPLTAAKKRLPDYLRSIGLDPSKNMHCLHHHPDEHPSMSLLPDGTAVHCFACGWHADIVDVIAEVEHLQPRSKDAIKRAIDFAGTAPVLQKRRPIDPVEEKQRQDKEAEENKKIEIVRNDIKAWHNQLISDHESQQIITNYLLSRGFSLDDVAIFIERFNLGFHSFCHNEHIDPCIIIPHGTDYYTARNINKSCHKDFRFIHNAKAPVAIFNPDALLQDVVFITEGAIDALSIIACGFHAIAIGGAKNKKNWQRLSKAMPNFDKKPIFIIAFDNDNAGTTAANDFDSFIKKECKATCTIANIPEHHDANDALQADRQGFASFLQHFVDGVLEEQRRLLSANLAKATSIPVKLEPPDANSDFAIADAIVRSFPNNIRYNLDRASFMTYQPPLWRVLNKDSELRPLVQNYRLHLEQSKYAVDKRICSDLQSSKRVNAVIQQFYSFDRLHITDNDLNQRTWLLPCKNGVVDLKTGKLFPHDGNQLWTRCANFSFEPDAPHSIFRAFIEQVIPDQPTRNTLQRFLGYCLTGSVEEEKALFVYGGGGNGKSTLFAAIMHCLDQFATPFKVDALLAGGRSSDAQAASPELNKLLFARLAVADEVPKGRQLDTAIFKLLTGGDRLPIRRLHHEASTIDHPTHKLILSGNHLPRLSDPNDEGLRRRLLILKFPCQFTNAQRDPKLKQKLVAPDVQSDIANWLIEGCLLWQSSGLQVSEQMQLEYDGYMRDNDAVAAFVDEYCVLAPDKSVSRQALFDHVETFGDRDIKALSQRELVQAFKEKLKSNGVQYVRTKKGFCFQGLGLFIP